MVWHRTMKLKMKTTIQNYTQNELEIVSGRSAKLFARILLMIKRSLYSRLFDYNKISPANFLMIHKKDTCDRIYLRS